MTHSGNSSEDPDEGSEEEDHEQLGQPVDDDYDDNKSEQEDETIHNDHVALNNSSLKK